MKKNFLTLMLAIVSSVWMANEASNWCMPSVRTLTELWIEVNGTFQAEGFPCEPDEECPPCLTIVLVTSNKTYYLVTDDGQLIEYLDTIQLGTKATVSGIPFTHGSYDYIQVSHIETDRTSQLPSLCDEWNIVVPPFDFMDSYYTYTQRLTTDTVINGQRYVKLQQEDEYIGALRENPDSVIYYIPANSTHEYLLYAFNAQVGDTLHDVWLGGHEQEYPEDGITVTVSQNDDSYGIVVGNDQHSARWIKGVGLLTGPAGWDAFPGEPVDPTPEILCAYKNGEQVYGTQLSERYGCMINGKPAAKPSSLCDEWNILEVSNVTSGNETYRTYKQRLTKDTIIAYPEYYDFQRYAKLEEDGQYVGAIIEERYNQIYFLPAGSTHRYLLYNFNAKVGDQLTNLWIGGSPADSPDGWTMTVEEIQETTPRTFVLSTGYTHTDEGIENYPLYITWIEGVGLTDGPIGVKRCVGCADSRGYGVLCAYKNGEHVYTSELGEQYGCEYNYDPNSTADTIPLFSYTGDDPGTSTVDPVDPNQVVATLGNEELTIREYTGTEITYVLTHRNNAPSRELEPQPTTFENEVVIELTEYGPYELQLSNEAWDYIIIGKFYYGPQGVEMIGSDLTADGVQKVIIDGQLLLRKGDKTYTLTGQEIKR